MVSATPERPNDGKEYDISHHRMWDAKVQVVAGGLTINKKTRGIWQSPVTGKIFEEAMIPVTIYCDRNNIILIAKMTLQHYNQESVMCYKISDEVILINKDESVE